MKTSIHQFLFLLILFIFPQKTWGGAWTREKGEVYSKLSVSRFESNETFDSKKNKRLPAPDFEDTSLFFYTEYGFTPKWTGILSLGYKDLTRDMLGSDQNESGFSDAWFYLKRALKTEKLIISAQAGAKIPMG